MACHYESSEKEGSEAIGLLLSCNIGVGVTLSVSGHNSNDSALLWKHCSYEGGAWWVSYAHGNM